ncbi:hypothetical protein DOTSEDRAFT_75468 [Dothistroma septosporum NZE10]|uniref:Uncharacterized protein n=1 Tax=Dothistroma septosporum (strain NZE10 / CBS 128990) TaxID=675120 RepID=M2XGW9_DOTSN|nr:hypothetical protein DOTSEDRAFT_75468 [Dothistroma septosporum NZE10]
MLAPLHTSAPSIDIFPSATVDRSIRSHGGYRLRNRMVGKEGPDVLTRTPRRKFRICCKLQNRDTPLPSIHILQNWGVERPRNAIGVALIAYKGDSFADGSNSPGKLVQSRIRAGWRIIDICSGDVNDVVADIVVEAVDLIDSSFDSR